MQKLYFIFITFLMIFLKRKYSYLMNSEIYDERKDSHDKCFLDFN